MTDPFELHEGESPLIVSFPHVGTELGDFVEGMTAAAPVLADTDWHLPRLYDFTADMGATRLIARYSRYVIDLNRDPSGASLYPGQNVTELCPTSTFAEEPLYLPGRAPDRAEVERRVNLIWKPYHETLKAQIARVVAKHGHALLWDAHSIRSRVPRFFEGRLPDFNLGTNLGATCGHERERRVALVAEAAEGYSAVLNGRFKGGYITRRYGQAAGPVESFQLELAQCTYMDESQPFGYDPALAAGVQPVIRRMIEAFVAP